MSTDRIYLGIGSTVLALRVADGSEVWRQRLATFSGGGMTGVALIGGRVYASCAGELTCLDPATGHIHWRNPLKGLGTGFICLAGAESAQGMAAAQAASASSSAAVIASTT